jgi:diguanylate cyclase (GGDEF)-like protein
MTFESLRRLYEPPESVGPDERSVYYLVILGGWMGLIIHAALLILFFVQSVNTMAWVNVGSIFAWLYYLHLAYRTKLRPAVYVACLEMTVHATFAAAVLGTQYGMHYYLISIAGLLAVNTKLNQRRGWLLSAFCLLLLIALYYIHPNATDVVIFPEYIKHIYLFFLMTACTPVVFGILIMRDEYIRQRTKLEHIANHDILTGLHNRRYFYQFLDDKKLLADKNDTPFFIAITDIDKFKSVNDSFGHDTGDEVLKEISALLLDGLHRSDDVARWGGEEFMLYIEAKSFEAAILRVDSIRVAISDARFSRKQLAVTSSFGLVMVNKEESVNSAVKRADALLYKAKQNGRNRIETSVS